MSNGTKSFTCKVCNNLIILMAEIDLIYTHYSTSFGSLVFSKIIDSQVYSNNDKELIYTYNNVECLYCNNIIARRVLSSNSNLISNTSVCFILTSNVTEKESILKLKNKKYFQQLQASINSSEKDYFIKLRIFIDNISNFLSMKEKLITKQNNETEEIINDLIQITSIVLSMKDKLES